MTAVAENMIGAGNCVEQAQKCFGQSDDDALVAVLERLAPEADRCPVADTASE